MEMKRIIFVVISCVLLLGLVLAGCEGNGAAAEGEPVGVWPRGSDATVAYYNNLASRAATGLNWTDLEYTGTQAFLIPEAWITIWEEWAA